MRKTSATNTPGHLWEVPLILTPKVACCTPGHQMLDGRELFQGFAGIPYHLATAGVLLRCAEVIFVSA